MMHEGKVRKIFGKAVVFALLVLFVWFEWELVCIAFAGILLAIVLHAFAQWITRHSPLGPRLSHLAALLCICAVVAGVFLLIAPRAINEISQLAATVPDSLHRATDYLQQKDWGRRLLGVLHRASGTVDIGAKVTQVATMMLAGTADVVVIVVVGIFGAIDPGTYKRGLLALAPPSRRPQYSDTLDRMGHTLRWWLLGQLVPMIFLGIASMVSLWLLGVQLAFTLGLLTGVFIFIPYVGSVAAGLLSVLVALQGGFHLALWVFLLYCVFHLIEGYILTPMVQNKAVRLPPALTILTQLFFWSFGGVLAVAVAAPATAAAMVAVERLYVRKQEAAGKDEGETASAGVRRSADAA